MSLPESVARELEVVDRALAGAAVDPADAELAELALLLAADRTEPSAEAAARLDARLAPRFAATARPGAQRPARRGRPWFLRPAFGAGLGLCLVLVGLAFLVGHGGGGSSGANNGPTLGPAPTHGSAPVTMGSSASSASSAQAQTPGALGPLSSPATHGPENLVLPQPQVNGRRIIHSDQLTLAAPAAQIGTVAQELFDVVGSERGIVKSSQVSSGNGAYASFTLSIPTANLSATVARLGQLRGARIISSSASTTDVNSSYLDHQRALADARALRTSLLRQLAAATTTTAIDSLHTQIHDAEQTIAREEASLNRLNGAISFTTVSVQINPGSVPVPRPVHHGLSLGSAWHTALDVLRTMAAVALVALAVLVPLGLVGGLVAWAWAMGRRRARERALDGV